jgi:hypothetical protein
MLSVTEVQVSNRRRFLIKLQFELLCTHKYLKINVFFDQFFLYRLLYFYWNPLLKQLVLVVSSFQI